jgi:coenzyme F420-0:L-glutamate ligase / coenzyme F420-1:gamma-L-glutamate ligase
LRASDASSRQRGPRRSPPKSARIRGWSNSSWANRAKSCAGARGVIVVAHRLGFVLGNAGIDASNVEGEDGEEVLLLLPENRDASAAHLRERLRASAGVDLGVIINDSFGRAWRLGTVGTAIGVAGLPGLLDLRGRPDRTERALQTTDLGVADEVAAAAALIMGQAAGGRPVVHVRGFPYARREGCAAELIRPKEQDLFR